MVAMSQNVQEEKIYWNTGSIMVLIARVGGEVIAMIGISNFLLSYYQ